MSGISIILTIKLSMATGRYTMQNKSQYLTQPATLSKVQEPDSHFLTTYNQIIQSLQTRTQLLANILSHQEAEKTLNAASKYKIVTHCNEYSKIVPLVLNVISNVKENSPLIEHEKFWHLNENLQRQLEAHLRQLKNVDMVIDNIVNQEFDKCNQIDQIEETIRIILSKKDANHIAKAEPYQRQRQQSLMYLAEKKQEKQKVKEEKLRFVKKILALLDQLKKHRQSGLKMCLVEEKEKKNVQNEQVLVERVINDFKQVQKNQAYLQKMGDEIKQLNSFISGTQKHIDQFSKQLCSLIEQQNQACIQLESILRVKSETEIFEQSLLTMFGVQNLRKKTKKDYLTDIQAIVNRLERFARENKEKQKQVSKIQQGIETTKKTINIFEHIIHKIQTESLRKKQLLKDIEKIQQKHSQQDRALAQIYETENEAEKLLLRKTQLNKNLQTKMNEANVAAYRSIHEEILKIQNEIKIKAKQAETLKQNAREIARQLYDETMELQESYEDILSEVVPSIWLKESDFTKEDSIKDLNLYLLKTFKRLSIAD